MIRSLCSLGSTGSQEPLFCHMCAQTEIQSGCRFWFRKCRDKNWQINKDKILFVNFYRYSWRKSVLKFNFILCPNSHTIAYFETIRWPVIFLFFGGLFRGHSKLLEPHKKTITKYLKTSYHFYFYCGYFNLPFLGKYLPWGNLYKFIFF